MSKKGKDKASILVNKYRTGDEIVNYIIKYPFIEIYRENEFLIFSIVYTLKFDVESIKSFFIYTKTKGFVIDADDNVQNLFGGTKVIIDAALQKQFRVYDDGNRPSKLPGETYGMTLFIFTPLSTFKN